MPQIITCPSGLKGRVRGFKAKEANLLADKLALKRGTQFDSILGGCWLETVDPGPYTFLEAGGAVDWSKILICDRFWSLLQIRAETYGDNYEFSLPCQERSCEKLIEWELKLSDLPVKPLPESSREQLRTGKNRFTSTLDDGKLCTYALMTGAMEMAVALAIKAHQQRVLVAALAHRIVEIDGMAEVPWKMKYLDDLEMKEVMRLVEIFDENDGGVETDIKVECQSCGSVQEVSLPLGREFFLPKAKKKKVPEEK